MRYAHHVVARSARVGGVVVSYARESLPTGRSRCITFYGSKEKYLQDVTSFWLFGSVVSVDVCVT